MQSKSLSPTKKDSFAPLPALERVLVWLAAVAQTSVGCKSDHARVSTVDAVDAAKSSSEVAER